MVHPLLTRSLKVNALFSGISGLLIVILSAEVAQWMGAWPRWLTLCLGVGLMVFAFDVGMMGWRRWRLEITPLIIGADLLWVLASIALVVWRPDWLSAPGAVVITGVAAAVFVLASLQLHGWLRSTV